MSIIRFFIFSFIALLQGQIALCQLSKAQAKSFFTNDSVVPVKLIADFQEIKKNRDKDDYRNATIDIVVDGAAFNNMAVGLKPRGKLRRELCNPPQLMIDFKQDKASPLAKLGKLKMVHACASDEGGDQLIYKEYLVYKLYQELTPLSFRVRLIRLEMEKSPGVAFSKPRAAFFLEDVDAMADRNDYFELPDATRNTETMDRNANTILAIFQFMIGNTDWSVPLNRNVKIVMKEGDLAPIAVPYDFDYCGLVNAPYAIPFEELPILSVTERLYRGYERSMEELETAINLFEQKKQKLYTVVESCGYLSKGNKKEMIDYLDSFYDVVNDKNKVKNLFIQNARKQ